MDCPKCLGKLQEKIIEHCKFDVCFICEGIWFDGGELDRVLKADAKDFNFDELALEELDGKEAASLKKELDNKECQCPRCGNGTKLIRKEHNVTDKITVDVCSKCAGVWLDGGEILALRHREAVDFRRKVDDNLSFLKFIFSPEGVSAFIQIMLQGGLKSPKQNE